MISPGSQKMRQKPRFVWGGALLAASLVTMPVKASVNKSITIGDNMEASGGSTVNGNITVGSRTTVTDTLSTVNGRIRVDDNSRLEDVETVNGSIRIGSGTIVGDVGSVNGSIRLGENVTVSGEIRIVNGEIEMEQGTTVAGDVSNINGGFQITAAEIGGNLTTVSGDVWLNEGSIIQGHLYVESPGSWSLFNKRKPRIVVGPGARVVGNIELEREVELYISESSEVGGVTGELRWEDAVRFSGDRPRPWATE